MEYFRFSTADFPEGEYINAYRNVHASIANKDMEPNQGNALFVEMVRQQLLPNLEVYESSVSPHFSRSSVNHAAGSSNDNLALVLPVDYSALIIPNNGGPLHCMPGEAVLMLMDSIHHVIIPNLVKIVIVVIFAPRMLFAQSVSELNELLLKKISSASAPELRLLVGYIRMLIQLKEDLSPELASLVSSQIHDLLALLLGARRDGMEITKNRGGVRAARLKAVKCDILEHVTDNELTIHQVALRQGICSQYIRALFHSEKTTFADYVTGLRLEQAYRLLCSPLRIDSSISTLAFDMGFNNLSWFNRVFKQRYGLTPSEARDLSRQSKYPS